MIYDFVELNKSSKEPMYEQLYFQLKNGIENKLISKDEKLPSIRKAATELKVSRTTIENAYFRLCSEGYIENKPQKGYFVKTPPKENLSKELLKKTEDVKYDFDFSSGKIDDSAADIHLWKRYVRKALNSEKDIISYGEPQGEMCLRKAIASYIYTARGVISSPENIVVGAGIQQLIAIFCCINKKGTVAIEEPGFKQAEKVFKDFGYDYSEIKFLNKPEKALKDAGADIYFNIPSQKPKTTAAALHAHRESLLLWLNSSKDHYILEDDFNGELKFSARPFPAMQNMCMEKIIYMGSFSKLLIPSVRISYAVFPESILKKYKEMASFYNQTASKIEQIALAGYIEDGHLEKHLRRLKKLYSHKSIELLREVNKAFPEGRAKVLESSLSIIFNACTKLSDEEIDERIRKRKVKIQSVHNGIINLSFAGIAVEDMENAVKRIKESLI